jgi:hypothetical protein
MNLEMYYMGTDNQKNIWENQGTGPLGNIAAGDYPMKIVKAVVTSWISQSSPYPCMVRDACQIGLSPAHKSTVMPICTLTVFYDPFQQ